MDDEEIFERWVRAHEQGDTETLDEYMDDGFVFREEGFEKELSKEEYLSLVDALHNAFPDLGVEAEEASVEEGVVQWSQGFSATHEQDLDLTELGLPFFFSTGNEVEASAETVRTELEDGKVSQHVVEGQEGCLSGLLSQVEAGLESIRQEADELDEGPPLI